MVWMCFAYSLQNAVVLFGEGNAAKKVSAFFHLNRRGQLTNGNSSSKTCICSFIYSHYLTVFIRGHCHTFALNSTSFVGKTFNRYHVRCELA